MLSLSEGQGEMTRPKIFQPGEIQPGMTVLIDGGNLRYIRQVLRRQPGNEIYILDGNRGRFPAIIREIGTEAAIVEITGEADNSGIHPNITLAQALVKGNQMDFLVEKAAELGSGMIIPFRSARSIPHLADEKARARVDRWQKIAIEAARQVGRASFPRVEEVTDFSQMLTLIPTDSLRLIFWEEERQQGIRELFLAQSPCERPLVTIVIGPEGGFTRQEVEEATDQGFISVSLGRQVFKVGTALMVIMAVIQYEMGFLDGGENTGGKK